MRLLDSGGRSFGSSLLLKCQFTLKHEPILAAYEFQAEAKQTLRQISAVKVAEARSCTGLTAWALMSRLSSRVQLQANRFGSLYTKRYVRFQLQQHNFCWLQHEVPYDLKTAQLCTIEWVQGTLTRLAMITMPYISSRCWTGHLNTNKDKGRSLMHLTR